MTEEAGLYGEPEQQPSDQATEGSISLAVKQLISRAQKLEGEKSTLNARLKEINKELLSIGRMAREPFEADNFPVITMGGQTVSLQLKCCYCVHSKSDMIAALKADEQATGIVREDFSKAKLDAYLEEREVADGKLPYEGVVTHDYDLPLIKFRKSR